MNTGKDSSRSTVTARLFAILKESGKTAKALSQATGIPESTISNWKNKNRDIPSDYIIPICEFLGISCEYLLTGNEEQKNPFATDQRDQELLKLFHNLTGEGKLRLIGRAEEMQHTYGLHNEKKQAK